MLKRDLAEAEKINRTNSDRNKKEIEFVLKEIL